MGLIRRADMAAALGPYSNGCLYVTVPESTAATQSRKVENQNKRDQWHYARQKVEIWKTLEESVYPHQESEDAGFLSYGSSNSSRHIRKNGAGSL